jgi:hypothetical protein
MKKSRVLTIDQDAADGADSVARLCHLSALLLQASPDEV